MLTPESIEEHRKALTGHCYRMLGSITEADDAVQETMLRALRGLNEFGERAALRTWLYRIATNVCLDLLKNRSRRERPVDTGPAGTVDDVLTQRDRVHWLEPVPDSLVFEDDNPENRLLQRESVRLAYVAALQYIPAKQRAALLLVDVLGWSAAQAAEVVDMTVAAVNSALQRARQTLASHGSPQADAELSASQQALVDRFVEAFEKYDTDAIAGLLREDIAFSMPPYSLWLRGPQSVRAWLLGRGCGCRGSVLVRTAANGQPAFGQYRADPNGGPHTPWALTVLELKDDRIASWTSFLDTASLFPVFGLPAKVSVAPDMTQAP